MYLYSLSIDLHTSNYHIQVIDVRSYNKDSYRITSHGQATLLVGVHPVYLTSLPKAQPINSMCGYFLKWPPLVKKVLRFHPLILIVTPVDFSACNFMKLKNKVGEKNTNDFN